MEDVWESVRGSARRGLTRGQEALTDLRETVRLHPGVTLLVGGTALGLLVWMTLHRAARGREVHW